MKQMLETLLGAAELKGDQKLAAKIRKDLATIAVLEAAAK